MQKPKSLVTGGAGFIGSHVAAHLLKNGHEVVVLDDLSGGFRDNVPPAARFVEGSILNIDLVENIFEQYGFDYVFHLAAYAAEGLSHFIRRFNYTNNLIGSVNLINAAVNHDVRCFVFTSSIAVYGAAQLPMTETTIPQPEDPYGVAKLAVERDLEAARRIFGLNYIIFRPHNVYGERQNIGDRYRNVVGIFMNQIMRGEALTIFGDGTQTRAFSHIDDVAPIIARSIDAEDAYGEVFNIGADVPCTVSELAQEVCMAMDVPLRVEHLPPRNEVQHAHADHSKAALAFGYRPATALREGVRKMAQWARQAGSRVAKPFEGIEISRNLPPSWAEAVATQAGEHVP
jgi:UDP-glucose 4-epimerase